MDVLERKDSLVKLSYAIGLVITLSLITSSVYASAPIQQFVFQGVLKDSTGGLITGVKNMTLRIFDIPTGGSGACTVANHCFWEENQTSISVVNGVFTINAGNKTSLSDKLNFTNALYLQVIVRPNFVNKVAGVDIFAGNDEIMKPRINMTSAPFALSASRGVGTDRTTAFNVTNAGNVPILVVRGGSTTNNVLNVTAGSLTTGSAVNIGSTSGSTGTRNLASIANSNTGATGTTVLKLTQAANQIAQQITSSSATANVMNVTAGSLTTGSAVNIGSTSGSTTTRALLNVTNTNTAATGTTVLKLQQVSSGDIIQAFNRTGTGTVFSVNSTGAIKIAAGTGAAGGIKFVGGTDTYIRSILIGSKAAINAGVNSITVTGAASGDVASCSFKGAGTTSNVFLTIGNVTSGVVSINATTNKPAVAFPSVVCIVFDLTP